jgi:predicted lactoylglutathione lyase
VRLCSKFSTFFASTVKDIDASISFYKAFGLELASNDGSITEVKIDGIRLQFVA